MPPIRRPVRSRGARFIPLAAALSLALAVQACSSASASSPAAAGATAAAAAAAAPAKQAGSAGSGSRLFGMHVPGLQTAFPASLGGTVGAVNLTVNGVYWPSLETSDGVWNWSHLDAVLGRAEANGARPLLVLGQTPSWAAPHAWSAPPMTAWRDYVRHVVEKYRTRVDYQIWPEPNIKSNWSGTPKQLASRVIAAAKIIHATAPAAVVVSPAMVLRMKYQRTFMDKFFAAKVHGKRVGGFMDAIGLDLYPEQTGTPEDSMVLLRKARSILRSHRVKAPQWNVEINYGVRGGGQTISHHSSATKQGSYVARTYVLNAAAKIKRVYWLGWGRYDTMDVAMVNAQGQPTKAGTVYQVVATWLAGQKSRGCAVKKKQHLYACKLVRAGRSSWVYWTTKGKTVVRAPKGSRHVATMTGDVSGTHAGKRLRVTRAPIRVYH